MGASTKIDWCDASWNPVTGCRHGCTYCYARGIAHRFGGRDTRLTLRECGVHVEPGGEYVIEDPLPRVRPDGKIVVAPYPFGFEPTMHSYKLDEPQRWKKPRTIFVCSMADLFGGWVPIPWILAVFDACKKAPQHRYLFLTKNPERYLTLARHDMLPRDENFWYGTTTTMPSQEYFFSDKHNTFTSIEPIQEPFGKWHFDKRCELPKWIILGAETGNRKGKTMPQKAWIDEIVQQARENDVSIFMKSSISKLMGADFVQEFPWMN